MKAVLPVLIWLAATALPAAAQSSTYVAGCVEKHGWTEAQCGRIYRHEVWIGMTNEMAEESLGQHISSNLQEVLGSGATAQIVYWKWTFSGARTGTVTLFFDSKLCKSTEDKSKMANLYSGAGRVRTICIVAGIKHSDVLPEEGVHPRLPQ